MLSQPKHSGLILINVASSAHSHALWFRYSHFNKTWNENIMKLSALFFVFRFIRVHAINIELQSKFIVHISFPPANRKWHFDGNGSCDWITVLLFGWDETASCIFRSQKKSRSQNGDWRTIRWTGKSSRSSCINSSGKINKTIRKCAKREQTYFGPIA